MKHICIERDICTPSTYHGIKQDLLEKPLTPLEKLSVLCRVCEGVMRTPYLTDTGYKCASCLGNNKNIRRARETEMEIHKLIVHCPFKNEGCLWDVELSLLILHMNSCELLPIACPNGCAQAILRKYLREHVDEKCSERETECEYCNCVIKLSQRNMHTGLCPNFPLECVNGCSHNIARNQMELHITKECPLSMVPCPFKRYCCSTVKRREIETHEAEFVVKHVRMMNTHIEEMEEVSQYSRGLKWEINGVKEKFSRNEKLYSEAFYVNQYKFKGSAKFEDGYLGLFIYLCQGENDINLMWPFLGNVIITLVNKRDSHHSITNSYSTDGISEFTKRSPSDRTGYGFATFLIEEEVLNSKFSEGDSIIIKFEVQHLPLSSRTSNTL